MTGYLQLKRVYWKDRAGKQYTKRKELIQSWTEWHNTEDNNIKAIEQFPYSDVVLCKDVMEDTEDNTSK